MSRCNDIQEKIARGDGLDDTERDHGASCSSCAFVTAEFALLEETLSAFGPPVPDGFADRVMRSLPPEAVRAGAGRGRWMTLTLSYAAGVIAVLNVATFLGHVFVASVALGGAP
jgi:hypothetical protein